MKQNIKSLTVYRQDLPADGNDDHHGAGEEKIISKTFYDERFNKIVREEQYASDGSLEQISEFVYNDNGFQVREYLKDGDGTIMEEKSYEPDENRRISREYLHYADGSKDVITYTYDDQGNLIKKETVDADGDVEELIEFEYQEGRLVHEVRKDGSGDTILEKLYHYDDGLLVETETFNIESEEHQKRIYGYNEQGHRESVMVYDGDDNPIERILLEPDEHGRPVKITEENRQKKNSIHLRYGDSDNVVFQEEFDIKGELLNRIERTYNENGLLLKSVVLVNMPGVGVQRRYMMRQEYEI